MRKFIVWSIRPYEGRRYEIFATFAVEALNKALAAGIVAPIVSESDAQRAE